MTERRWTRRSIVREAVDGAHYILRMFEGKTGKLSMLRVIVFGFAVGFWRHWPELWNDSVRDALALIVFALPVADLFALIPGAEALAALQSFFLAAIGKAGLVPGTTVESSSSMSKTVIPTIPAPDTEPPQEQG